MSNALALLRRSIAPAARRRAATVAKLLPGGRVELAVSGDTSGSGIVTAPDAAEVYAWADAPGAWVDAPGAWSGVAASVSAVTTVARPEVHCGVAVAVGDRVLVEGDRVVSKLAREAETIVRIK